MAFALSSPAFAKGAVIPGRFTCDGLDLSPQLDWSETPPSAKSFVLIVDDPDAPSGTFTHWVLFDIPAATRSLAEGQKPGGVGVVGKNDFSRTGYGGPCPPRGHGPHRYCFVLSALDIDKLGLSAGASRQQVEARMRGHVVGTARWMGKYERK
jgi:Raf kinase inhibitor-like YbhB/YbcL family protein